MYFMRRIDGSHEGCGGGVCSSDVTFSALILERHPAALLGRHVWIEAPVKSTCVSPNVFFDTAGAENYTYVLKVARYS